MPLVFVLLALASPLDLSKLTVPIPDPIEIQKVEWIEALHQCENANNVLWIIDTNGKRSYGYVMFQMQTWLKYTKQGATRDNIGDDEMQKTVARYILDTKGDGDWYTCGKVTVEKLGAYPMSEPSQGRF